MRWLFKCGAVLGITVLVLLALAPAAFAAETASSDVVIVREDVVIDEDFYATGLRVVIQGEIRGDLIAFAGEEVVIEGLVTGSVLAVTQDVTVSGSIGGSLRVTGTNVTVSGDVGGDVVTAAAVVDLNEGSTIGGDALMWAYRATSAGTIEGDLEGTCRSLELSGTIGRNVDVTVTRLTMTGPLEVGGDLGYRSKHVAEGLEMVEVGGVVVQLTPLAPNVRIRALGLMTRLLVGIALTATSLLVAMGWPATVESASERIRTRPLRSFGIGLAVFASPLALIAVAGALLSLTPAAVSLPLMAILIPLALALAGLVLVISLVAGAPSVLVVGRLVRKSLGIYGAIFLGGAIAALIWLIPAVGWAVPFLILPFGLGGWLGSLHKASNNEALEPA